MVVLVIVVACTSAAVVPQGVPEEEIAARKAIRVVDENGQVYASMHQGGIQYWGGGDGGLAQSELMGLSPIDPVSFGAAAAVLFLIVLLASLVPARRASKVDPMDALRYE